MFILLSLNQNPAEKFTGLIQKIMKSFSALLLLFCAGNAFAQINNCLPPTSQTDLDINNHT